MLDSFVISLVVVDSIVSPNCFGDISNQKLALFYFSFSLCPSLSTFSVLASPLAFPGLAISFPVTPDLPATSGFGVPIGYSVVNVLSNLT
jgi:hypothetical protein